MSSKTEMDSINISVIQVADTTVFDSIMKAINGGAKASSFISKNDQDTKTQGADSVWIQLCKHRINGSFDQITRV